MVTERNGRGGAAATQRGAALLLALVLTVSLSMLALSVLASRDMAVVVADHAEARARARHAAASGIEWATAVVMDQGFTAQSRKLVLADGDEVAVTVDPVATPQVVAKGTCDGVEVRLGADVDAIDPPAPGYAWVSLSGVTTVNHTVSVLGSAYLGALLMPVSTLSRGTLAMHGNLDLTAAALLDTSVVTHVSGTTQCSVAAITAPTIDTAAFPSSTTGGVSVTTFTGDTTLADTTQNGILLVTLAAGQTLTLDTVTINGTIVVTAPDSALLRPMVHVLATCTINGGTALTGNLALLAPTCALKGKTSNSSLVAGVSFVYRIEDMNSATFRGQLITQNNMQSTAGDYTIERPVGFVPSTPLGITWPGTPKYRIGWRGEL